MLPHLGLTTCSQLLSTQLIASKQSVPANSFSRSRCLTALPATCAKQQVAQPAQPRHAKAVELRRGDMSWRQPPWHFVCTTTADTLQLGSLKEIDSAEAKQASVAVQYAVSPTGAGYFVTGNAQADLPLQCDCCLATFKQPITALFKLWLDPSIGVDEIPHDPSQLPFPPEMSTLDLGPSVSDAIILVLPSVNLCGRSDCNIKHAQSSSTGASGWSAAPTTPKTKKGRQKAKQTGQFASLKQLGRK